VGRRLSDPQARAGSAGAVGASASAEPPATITLLLDPQQAVTMQYLLQNGGSIALAMRRFDQGGDLPTEPVTAESLTRRVLGGADSGGAASPVPPGPIPGP